MIRLFASDVDGTLLNEKHKISDNVKEMVLNLHKNDVTFLFCSGRNFDGIKIIMDDLNVPAHYICSNGGVYYNENKELVFSQCLNEEDSLTIHEMAIKSDVTVQYYAKEKAYIQVPFDQYEKCNIKNFMAMMDVTQEEAKKFLETFNTRKLFIYEPDFNEILKKGIVKIEFHYRDKETKLIWEKQLKSMKNIHVTSSVDLNLEVSHKKATKGDMLLRVAKHLGLKEQEVAVIGDSDNDITMLSMFTHSYAMGNASDHVKKYANHVVAFNSEDGVAQAMKDVLEKNARGK